ncbi:MAG: hypothetical protein V4582_01590 [Pseudomonadota bacterium]
MISVTPQQLRESAGANGAAQASARPGPESRFFDAQAGLDMRALARGYAEQGAPFKPLLMKFAAANEFVQVPTLGQCNAHGMFWQIRPRHGEGKRFLPLGDMVTPYLTGPKRVPAMLLARDPAYPHALAHPIGFERIAGEGAGLELYRLIAPAGYSALGIAFEPGAPSDYWCVANEFIEDVADCAPMWPAVPQGWPANPGLVKAAIGASDRLPMGDVMYVLPNTPLPAQHPEAARRAALKLGKLRLEIEAIALSGPEYAASGARGAQYSPGLSAAFVLPCTAIDGRKLANQAQETPFYFVLSRPLWKCILSLPAHSGGAYQLARMMGVAATSASEFRRATSLMVSPFGMVSISNGSAAVCASFTQECELMTSASMSRAQTSGLAVPVDLPMPANSQFWQLFQRLEVCQGDGTLVSAIDFGRDQLQSLPARAA